MTAKTASTTALFALLAALAAPAAAAPRWGQPEVGANWSCFSPNRDGAAPKYYSYGPDRVASNDIGTYTLYTISPVAGQADRYTSARATVSLTRAAVTGGAAYARLDKLTDSANTVVYPCGSLRVGFAQVTIAAPPAPPAPPATAAIIIRDVRVTNITRTGATITWNTNRPSNTTLSYRSGTTGTAYDRRATATAGMRTGHTVTLSGLTAGRAYAYLIQARGAAGAGASVAGTFNTAAAAPVTAPVGGGVTPPVVSEPATGLPPMSTGQLCRRAGSDLDFCNTLDHRLMFEVPMSDTDFNDLHPDDRASARASEATLEREKHWLTFAQHKAWVDANCLNTRSVACINAVRVARRQFLANMRDGAVTGAAAGAPQTYKAAYGRVYPLVELPNGERGDVRAGTIHTVLRWLGSVGRYGTNGRGQEIALLRREVDALRNLTTPVGTTGKTGPDLLAQYVADMRAIIAVETERRVAANATDHVGRRDVTERYRQHVPATARYQSGQDNEAGMDLDQVEGPPQRLSRADETRLRRDNPALGREYDAAWAGRDVAVQRTVTARARQWLADHPTLEQFNALAELDKRRICRDVWDRERTSTGGAVTVVAGANNQLTAAAGGNTDGIVDGNVPGGAVTTPGAAARSETAPPPPAAYTWPPAIVEQCRRLLASDTTAPGGPTTAVPTPGGGSGLSVGQPIEGTSAAEPPKTSWNPLLNGAKGAILGGIVGFVLGGPLGLLVGAAIFGGAAWGMTKIGDA